MSMYNMWTIVSQVYESNAVKLITASLLYNFIQSGYLGCSQ